MRLAGYRSEPAAALNDNGDTRRPYADQRQGHGVGNGLDKLTQEESSSFFLDYSNATLQ